MYLDVFTTLGVPLLIGMILKAKMADMMEKVAPIIGKISVLFLIILSLVRQKILVFLTQATSS